MSKIIELEIRNYRGIKSFREKIHGDFICFTGRGDSGKTTILDAISSVLSPSWNLTFYDTDFYNCNINEPIEIIASILEPPLSLLLENKYGLLHRVLNPVTNEIEDELKDSFQKVLTIKLKVDRTLEPQWTVSNNRPQNDKDISAADRAKLNCFIISDDIDRHFSWNKGTPLHTLLKLDDRSPVSEKTNNVIEALREAKLNIDQCDFSNLSSTIDKIISKAASIGLNISNTKTTIDFKDLYIRDGRVCLHEDNIPFRLKGKGSKRLASIAIQSAIADEGGIVLIDEIEQGLEPDRTKQLVRTLKEDFVGQVFITTHSRDVITEINSQCLRIVHRNEEIIKIAALKYDDDKLKSLVRACPEAFFAKKIIVCEGKTEIGICRAIDRYRKDSKKALFSFKDCAYVLGEGSSFAAYAEKLKEAEFEVAVFCDSEQDTTICPSKEKLKEKGIEIFDCDKNNFIEKQIFCDLPWQGVIDLLKYVMSVHNKTEISIKSSVKAKFALNFPEDWMNSDSIEMRIAISEASHKNEWFKRIDHGEYVGTVIFKYIDKIAQTHLAQMINNLSKWVDS